jgi:hypothetical protein
MPRKEAPRASLNDSVRQVTPLTKSFSRKTTAPRASTLLEAEEKSRATPYEEWSKHDLYEKAEEVGIEGRARMSKRDLINTLRDY